MSERDCDSDIDLTLLENSVDLISEFTLREYGYPTRLGLSEGASLYAAKKCGDVVYIEIRPNSGFVGAHQLFEVDLTTGKVVDNTTSD